MRAAWRRRPLLFSALKVLVGFLAGLGIWIALSPAYERTLASVGETLLRATESPAVTRLTAGEGEIVLNRTDFPPTSSRPGLPAPDLHFNFVLLAALFALAPKPWRGEPMARFAIGCALLFATHLLALVFEVRALYATKLGEWSAVHYGAVARNFWAGGFHFYLIAGRFAAPFAIWWATSGVPGEGDAPAGERPGGRRKARGRSLRAVK